MTVEVGVSGHVRTEQGGNQQLRADILIYLKEETCAVPEEGPPTPTPAPRRLRR